MEADRELQRLRTEMDDLNHRLAGLLHERAQHCRAIGRCKRASGLPPFDAEREAAMLDQLPAPPAADGFPADALRRIFAQVITESRSIVESTFKP